jgi:hypothetical protein
VDSAVLPLDLTTNAVMFVDGKGKLSKDLGLAIVNPNTSNANVSLTLRGSDENQLGIKTVNVPSHQHTSRGHKHPATLASGSFTLRNPQQVAQ